MLNHYRKMLGTSCIRGPGTPIHLYWFPCTTRTSAVGSPYTPPQKMLNVSNISLIDDRYNAYNEHEAHNEYGKCRHAWNMIGVWNDVCIHWAQEFDSGGRAENTIMEMIDIINIQHGYYEWHRGLARLWEAAMWVFPYNCKGGRCTMCDNLLWLFRSGMNIWSSEMYTLCIQLFHSVFTIC